MKHKIRHGLEHDLARKVTHKAFDSYQKRYAQFNPQADWITEDKANVAFSVKGVSLDGSIEITDDDVIIDLKVPFVFKPFRKKAVGVIESEIRDWIDKAKRGEID
jgi:hypothetical protein